MTSPPVNASAEDALGSFPSERDPAIRLHRTPILQGLSFTRLTRGIRRVSSALPLSLPWLCVGAVRGSMAAITACAFACGLVVGASVIWLSGVSASEERLARKVGTWKELRPEPVAPATSGVAVVRNNSSEHRIAQRPVAPARTLFRGSLVIDSRPSGAQVFLNGRSAGTTPLVLKNQTAGSRAVRVALDGYDSWTSVVQIVADTRTRLRAELKARPIAQP